MADRQFLEQLSKKLADDGRLIEAGWVTLRIAAMDPTAPKTQLDEMRMAFMAGAQHLFASIMTVLDPGDTETAADLRRMNLIDRELRAFADELKLRLATAGRA